MRSTSGAKPIDNFLEQQTCARRHLFQGLPRKILEDFEAISYTRDYTESVSLVTEGRQPRGIYLLRQGRAKLITHPAQGKARITRIAEAEDVLGLSETIANVPYEMTAETLTRCRVDFVSRANFLRFLREHPPACFRVVQLLGQQIHAAYKYLR